MLRIAWASVLFCVLSACASHRPVKVNCSGHLVRINADAPIAAKTSQAPVETPPGDDSDSVPEGEPK